ncbi:hypothetical protein HUJ04_009898 [Dendroctonus ponderosae]|nr:hypothetical protein HUJ04_009898 [Dendroctonus ponderosae]
MGYLCLGRRCYLVEPMACLVSPKDYKQSQRFLWSVRNRSISSDSTLVNYCSYQWRQSGVVALLHNVLGERYWHIQEFLAINLLSIDTNLRLLINLRDLLIDVFPNIIIDSLLVEVTENLIGRLEFVVLAAFVAVAHAGYIAQPALSYAAAPLAYTTKQLQKLAFPANQSEQ